MSFNRLVPTAVQIVPIGTDPTDPRSAAVTGNRASRVAAIDPARVVARPAVSAARRGTGRHTSQGAVATDRRTSRAVAVTVRRISPAVAVIGRSRRDRRSNARPTRAACRFASILGASTH